MAQENEQKYDDYIQLVGYEESIYPLRNGREVPFLQFTIEIHRAIHVQEGVDLPFEEEDVVRFSVLKRLDTGKYAIFHPNDSFSRCHWLKHVERVLAETVTVESDSESESEEEEYETYTLTPHAVEKVAALILCLAE